MALKLFKPVTPSSRGLVRVTHDDLSKEKPLKKLTKGKSEPGGRNNLGRVTMRFRGGGHKRKFRAIDFLRDKDGVPATVATVEYDPNRTARIALLNYADGDKRYIIAPEGIEVGQKIMSGPNAEIKNGNALPLQNIPVGSTIHNIEMIPGKGAQICRSAGTSAQLVAREGKYAQIRLKSGEIRIFPVNCKATIGQVGNAQHENQTVGKAGRSRWLGNRPHNRGVAMNPIDHPHGGGEGRTSGGGHPRTPWGIPTKGYKTRRGKKASDKFIVQRRKKK